MKNNDGRQEYGIFLDNSQLRTNVNESKSMFRGIGDTAVAESSRIDSAYKKAAGAAVALFSAAAIKQFGMELIDITGKFQTFEAVLTNTLQSPAKAKQSMMMLQEFAATTPFQVDALTGAFVKLANQGFVPTYAQMVKLGDLASSTGKGFDQLTEAIIDAQTGEFERLKEFGIRASKDGDAVTFTFKEQQTQVDFTASSIRDYVLSLGELKGVQGANAQIAKTLTGQVSNLQDGVTQMMNEIGQSSEGVLSGAVSGVAFLVENYETVGSTLMNLIAVYGTYRAALITINALQALNNKILRQAVLEKKLAAMAGVQLSSSQAVAAASTKMLSIAQQGLTKSIKAAGAAMMANPYALIAAAIAGIGFVLYKVLSQQSEFEKAQERLSEANSEVTQEFTSEIRQLNALERKLSETKKGSEEYKAVKDEIVKNYGKYYDGLDAEIEKVGNLSTAYETLVEKIRLSIGARKFESFFQAEQDNLDKVIGEKLDKAYEVLIEKYGKDKGNKLYSQLFDKIMRGTELSRETWKELNAATFTEWGFENSPVGVAQRSVSSLAFDVDKVQRASDKAVGDFKQIYQVTDEQMTEFLLGKKPSVDTEESSITITLQEVIKNIKEAETTLSEMRKKSQQGLISDEDVKKQEDKVKKLKESYKTKTDKNYDEKPTKKDKPKDYTEQLAKDAQAKARLEIDFEHAVRQAKVNAMDEGIEKVLAQNQLNFDKEKEQVERQKADMLADIQNWERNIWEAQNPNWEKEGKKFTPKTTQLSSEQFTGFDAMVAAASKKMELANKDALDAMLNDYMTYEQRRDKVIEDYEKRRKTMQNADGSLKPGVKQGNVDELNRSETDSLAAIDEEFAQREDTYEAWMNQIANYALNQLEQALVEAKRKLKELEESGTTDSKKLSVARAKVNTAQKKVSKAKADNEASPGKRTIKEWEDLYSTLREVEGEFKNIGDTVGGVAGEIITTAGQIMSSTLSMVNGIVQLVNMSAVGMQGTAVAAASAISTVEKASVILTIISAAMQIAMTIINLFNNDKQYQEEIENLQGRIDQLQWELDNADALRLQNNTFKTLQKVREVYAEATREVLKLHAANNQYSNALYQMFGRVIYQNEIMERSVERLAKAYANISYTADKALGEEKFSGAKDQLENIAEQQLLIQQQIDAENSKKKTDNGQIKEWEQKIQELGAEANQIINEIVEEIIGGSSSDIAEELGNAFIDAFRDGEDAAEAWGAKVNDIVADVMKRMLISKFLEKPLGEIFDKYKSKWYKDGQFAGIDAIMESMGGFANDLNAVGSEFQTIWENLPEDVKNMFAPTEETREASQKGIASASQESVDELNGRMTAVQGHTYLLSENSKILVANSNRVLQHLAGIESNTESLSQLENIKTDINGLKKVMDDIALKGIKLK